MVAGVIPRRLDGTAIGGPSAADSWGTLGLPLASSEGTRSHGMRFVIMVQTYPPLLGDLIRSGWSGLLIFGERFFTIESLTGGCCSRHPMLSKTRLFLWSLREIPRGNSPEPNKKTFGMSPSQQSEGGCGSMSEGSHTHATSRGVVLRMRHHDSSRPPPIGVQFGRHEHQEILSLRPQVD